MEAGEIPAQPRRYQAPAAGALLSGRSRYLLTPEARFALRGGLRADKALVDLSFVRVLDVLSGTRTDSQFIVIVAIARRRRYLRLVRHRSTYSVLLPDDRRILL